MAQPPTGYGMHMNVELQYESIYDEHIDISPPNELEQIRWKQTHETEEWLTKTWYTSSKIKHLLSTDYRYIIFAVVLCCRLLRGFFIFFSCYGFLLQTYIHCLFFWGGLFGQSGQDPYGCFLKWWVKTPQIIHLFIGFFHYFHHPFWGKNYFLDFHPYVVYLPTLYYHFVDFSW